MNQLAKVQLQQVQGTKQVNAIEGVNIMVNKRRQRGQQVQNNQDQYEQSGSDYNQDDSYDDQSEEVLYANNYQDDEIQANDENANNEVRIDIDDNMEETENDVNLSREHVIDIPETVVPKAKAPLPSPPPPYPQSLAKQNNENQFKKFIEMMKNLSINVPLVEALEQIPVYAKFMKDLVTKKSADFAKALCDLGARINLMPYSVFKTLCIGKPRATSMRLQMEDRTMKRPLDIIDDVLVRVDNFILPADFVILDCKVDYEVSTILGRPFLATGKALVDVEAGELTFRVGDEKVVFHVCKSMRQPNSNGVCSFLDLVTKVIVDDTSAMINVEDPLEAVLLNHEDDEKEGLVECANAL
ncbi:uncharacterized protein [Nicotiana tomentosiformis]|uniref:uncharacterized protein n=1 Tax=Nicotiana tomentosiformis TaxID=4098 RepID=UPI00388CE97C